MNPDDSEGAEVEKVSDLRSRLKSREKEKNDFVPSDESKISDDSSNSGGTWTPLLWAAMLVISGFSAWQFAELRNNLTGNVSNFDNAQINSNPSYEYAVDFVFDTNLDGRMAQRGKDGWKIVGSRRTQDNITGKLGYEFIFTRESKN